MAKKENKKENKKVDKKIDKKANKKVDKRVDKKTKEAVKAKPSSDNGISFNFSMKIDEEGISGNATINPPKDMSEEDKKTLEMLITDGLEKARRMAMSQQRQPNMMRLMAGQVGRMNPNRGLRRVNPKIEFHDLLNVFEDRGIDIKEFERMHPGLRF